MQKIKEHSEEKSTDSGTVFMVLVDVHCAMTLTVRRYHCIIMVEVQAGQNRDKIADDRPNWFRADFNAIKNHLDSHDWRNVLNNETVEQDWSRFKEILDYCTDTFVPQKRILKNDKPKWLTRDLVKLIRRKKSSLEEL
jgi:hypothetical protein